MEFWAVLIGAMLAWALGHLVYAKGHRDGYAEGIRKGFQEGCDYGIELATTNLNGLLRKWQDERYTAYSEDA